MEKTFQYNKPSEEVFANLRQAINRLSEPSDEFKKNIIWDDIAKTASIDHKGLKAEFKITGSNPCVLKVSVTVMFPASVMVKTERIIPILEQTCAGL
ncbi:MAG: hypothetical protein V1701_06295 [Planctomycetota bacterium]